MRCCSVAAGVSLLFLLIVATPGRAAVMAGQVDDFESGDLQSWQTGAGPNPGVNVATGGPAGADDNFARLTANGGASGGRLVMFNANQWTGNYRAAHVDEIRMEVNSFLITPPPLPPPTLQATLNLRLILFDALDGITLSTVADVLVTPGSGWQTVTFPLTAANLQARRTDPLATVTAEDINIALSNVTELDFVHSSGPLFLRQSSPPVVAQVGVDNIRAVTVPEPALAGAAGVAGVAAMMRRTRVA